MGVVGILLNKERRIINHRIDGSEEFSLIRVTWVEKNFERFFLLTKRVELHNAVLTQNSVGKLLNVGNLVLKRENDRHHTRWLRVDILLCSSQSKSRNIWTLWFVTEPMVPGNSGTDQKNQEKQ
jgi:hypothetical protein